MKDLWKPITAVAALLIAAVYVRVEYVRLTIDLHQAYDRCEDRAMTYRGEAQGTELARCSDFLKDLL